MNFINPKTDFAFKKIFGSDDSKDILISFLNALLYEAQPVIEDLEIIDPYLAPNIKGIKDTYLDVKAKITGDKTVIIEMIHYADELPKINNSDYISTKVRYDYTYLANLFSEVEKISIQAFIINQKIERAKDLIKNGELTLTAIASKLHYSSIAHLSNQFKKVTGINPTNFKELQHRQHPVAEDV